MAFEEGITYQDLFAKLKEIFMQSGPWTLVGHNVKFDRNVLANAILRRGDPHFAEYIATRNSVCTMALAKNVLQLDKFPKLIDLYKLLFDGDGFACQHNAQADIQATFDCFQKLKPLMKSI